MAEPSATGRRSKRRRCFGSEERRLFHAGRGICERNADMPTGGSVVVNVMLDYETLPFITVRNPYNELIRPADTPPPEGSVGRAVQFVVYGWGRGSHYSSSDPRMAARRYAAERHRTVTASILDDDERRRAQLFDLYPERPCRHLRDRVSRDHADGSPDQSRGALDARRPHLCRAADAGVVCRLRSVARPRPRAARCCAKYAPASTASCSSHSSRRRFCR